MKTLASSNAIIRFALISCVSWTATESAFADGGLNGTTAVMSTASKDYVRPKLSDGKFQTEFYAFGDGGNWGGDIRDVSIDKLRFLDVAHVIANALALQNYVSSKEPNNTELLIMLYWGTTTAPQSPDRDPIYAEYYNMMSEYRIMLESGDPSADAMLSSALTVLSMANHARDRLNLHNAALLGYDADGLISTDYGKYVSHGALGIAQRDETKEIADPRYFVVLMAYDFQMMWKQKKHKLLWVTRFSVNEGHNEFDKALPIMADYASRYFGQDSKGLLRTRVPDGHVDIGDVKSLGPVPEK